MNTTVEFTVDEVMHRKYPSLSSDPHKMMYGQSPLLAGRASVNADNEAMNASVKGFQNMGIAGIISSKEAGSMEEDDAMAMHEKFKRESAGTDNFNKIKLTGAAIEWTQLGMSPVDLAIIDSRIMSLRDVCNLYGVNTALFNDPETKRDNNVELATRGLWQNAVLPELDDLQGNCNTNIVSRYNKANKTKYAWMYSAEAVPVLQSDRAKMREGLLSELQGGAISLDEYRIAMGKPALETPESQMTPYPHRGRMTSQPQGASGSA